LPALDDAPDNGSGHKPLRGRLWRWLESELAQKLGREPTEEEIKAYQEQEIKKKYALGGCPGQTASSGLSRIRLHVGEERITQYLLNCTRREIAAAV
jgi:hypothetical protein